MALVLVTATADALADAIDVKLSAGVTQSGAKIVLETSGDVEVSLHRMEAVAFGASSGGVISAASLPKDDTSAAGGTVAQYSWFDRQDVKMFEGEVAVSGKDLDLSSLSVGVGDTVSLTAFTITVT